MCVEGGMTFVTLGQFVSVHVRVGGGGVGEGGVCVTERGFVVHRVEGGGRGLYVFGGRGGCVRERGRERNYIQNFSAVVMYVLASYSTILLIFHACFAADVSYGKPEDMNSKLQYVYIFLP